jgi:hypothetical protein
MLIYKIYKNIFLEDNPKKQRIDLLLVNLITTDLRLLSIVEDSGFVALLKFLDPKYRLPRKLLKT